MEGRRPRYPGGRGCQEETGWIEGAILSIINQSFLFQLRISRKKVVKIWSKGPNKKSASY